MSSGSARPERIVLRYGALLSLVTLDRVRESSFSSFEASDAGCSHYQRDDYGGGGGGPLRGFCGKKALSGTFLKKGHRNEPPQPPQTKGAPAARAKKQAV